MNQRLNNDSALKPRRNEVLLVEAKSVEVDLAYLSEHWKSLRIEKTENGVCLFVKKEEKNKKDIHALGTANHPFCRTNEYLAFRPYDEGIDKIFEFLYFKTYRQQPDKKARTKWFDGLSNNGVRTCKDPNDPKGRGILVFLDKKWQKII